MVLHLLGKIGIVTQSTSNAIKLMDTEVVEWNAALKA